jgi:hypothetical protein
MEPNLVQLVQSLVQRCEKHEERQGQLEKAQRKLHKAVETFKTKLDENCTWLDDLGEMQQAMENQLALLSGHADASTRLHPVALSRLPAVHSSLETDLLETVPPLPSAAAATDPPMGDGSLPPASAAARADSVEERLMQTKRQLAELLRLHQRGMYQVEVRLNQVESLLSLRQQGTFHQDYADLLDSAGLYHPDMLDTRQFRAQNWPSHWSQEPLHPPRSDPDLAGAVADPVVGRVTPPAEQLGYELAAALSGLVPTPTDLDNVAWHHPASGRQGRGG